MLELRTPRLLLRAPRDADVAPLAALLAAPEVARFWPAYDEARIRADLFDDEAGLTVLVIEEAGVPIGLIQFFEQNEPQFRHATIDLFLGAAWQGAGRGEEAIRAIVEHLITLGHHRMTIDPAAENQRAIRTYTRIGFRPVGVLRAYEHAGDGRWRDGLLMELFSADYRRPGAARAAAPVTARRAIEDDAPLIMDMMVDFNRLEHIPWTRERGEAPLRELLRRADIGQIGILEDGREVAGYFVMTYGYDLEWNGRDAFLTELYLHEAARGRGLGRAALAAVEAAALTAGARALHLMVRVDNGPALRLYLDCGYESPPRLFLSKTIDGRR